jgi:hypothetical protein
MPARNQDPFAGYEKVKVAPSATGGIGIRVKPRGTRLSRAAVRHLFGDAEAGTMDVLTNDRKGTILLRAGGDMVPVAKNGSMGHGALMSALAALGAEAPTSANPLALRGEAAGPGAIVLKVNNGVFPTEAAPEAPKTPAAAAEDLMPGAQNVEIEA